MSRLRCGAMVLAYKQEEYVSYCLHALAPRVDDVVVLFSEQPWIEYNPDARRQFRGRDATREILGALCDELPNVRVVEGLWDGEADMRNAGLAELRRLGAELALIVDADEIHPDGAIEALRDEAERAAAPGASYFGRYVTCYRRFDYVVESDHRTTAAVHIAPATRFVGRKAAGGPRRLLPDSIWFWHLGYVLSDRRMWEKIHTFGHAHELVPDWFEEKWLKWTPETTDLFRKRPRSRWPRTRRIDPRVLPTVLHDHPFFPDGHAT